MLCLYGCFTARQSFSYLQNYAIKCTCSTALTLNLEFPSCLGCEASVAPACSNPFLLVYLMQMIVTTPEKWDVVTRKATGDVQLAQIVRLLVIDEVHLLHEDRGAVIESLVARTLRQVESSQTMIRIVGLSATLPNYLDVAQFLRVNPQQGLFFFDGRFRPVPLSQTFVGIKTTNRLQQLKDMEDVCYEKVLKNICRGHQVGW